MQAAPAPEGPLASAWKAQLTSCLSAPVIARGRVFVARTDAGQIVALDVATGKELWSTTLGGRIDTPPTIHRGLCLVGCHDGWVYALRAKDGQLAWRSRLAPRERRMVAWGAVESVWPAIGTVLVHENVAYATAGRSSESDGGIAAAALDPATGSSLWSKAIGPGALRMNDALAVRDGSLAWRYMRLDPNSGSVTTPTTRHTLKQYGGGKGRLEGGMIDGTWTFLRNRRAGNAFTIGKVTASIMVWNEKVVVSPKGATSREKETPIWQTRPVRSRPIAAMALTRNVVLVAGRNELTRGGHATGFLRVVSMADGKRIAEFPLDAAPAHDGLAVAGGRVYLSLRNGKLLCLGKAD